MGLSVNIICQDEEETLPYTLHCVESVLQPVLENVVIVDGGSVDGTLGVIEEYASRLPITLVQHPFDACGWQKNRGLELCKGRWILDLDGDMTFTSNLAEVFSSGYFEVADAWNFGLFFTVVDPYHTFDFSNLCGPSLRLFRSKFRFVKGFHQDIDSPRSCTDKVYVFENSHLQTQVGLLKRGQRWQGYDKKVQEAGPSMGESWRYLETEFWGRANNVPIPPKVASLVIPRNTLRLQAIDRRRSEERPLALGLISEWVRRKL